MHLIRKVLLLFLLVHSLTSFGQGTWVQKANLDSFYIQQAVGFAVNGKGYCIAGADCYAGTQMQVLEYDPFTNIWTRLANFPGDAFTAANGFSIGNFGYVVTGRGIAKSLVSQELWEFNSLTKTWTRKADLAGPGRCSAFAFSIGKKGYVGTGYNNAFDRINDFWEWDQQTNLWTQKANFPGNRSEATGFSIDVKGYAGLGSTDSTSCSSAFWEYNPATDTWTSIAPYPGGCSIMQSVYTICNKAYVGAGLYLHPFGWYEYDALTDTWTTLADVPGPFRKDAFSFAINKKGYIGTGAGNPNCNNDFYEFSASTVYNCNMTDISDEEFQPMPRIYPNPFTISTTIEVSENNTCRFYISDVSGTLIRTLYSNGNLNVILDRGSLANGVYFITKVDANGCSKPQKLVLLGED